MVIHAKKSTFILKMHKPSIIILDSMINKWRKNNERTKVKFSFSEGETERCTKRLEGLVKTLWFHFAGYDLSSDCIPACICDPLWQRQSLHSSTISEHGDFYGTAGYCRDVFLWDIIQCFETGIFQGVCNDGKAYAPCGTALGAVSVYDAGRSGVLQNRTISDRCDLCDSHLHRPDHLEKNSSKQDEWRKPFSVGRDDKRYGRAGRS